MGIESQQRRIKRRIQMSNRLETLDDYYFVRTEIDKMNKMVVSQTKKLEKLAMSNAEIEESNAPLLSLIEKYEENVKDFEDRFEGLL